MTDQPTQRLSSDEIVAVKFAVHRQLARWAAKGKLSPHQHAQRAALVRAVRILEERHSPTAATCKSPARRPSRTSTSEDWRKIDRGLFESADDQWRISNPWKLSTEMRHRRLVAERHSNGSGWCMHDGDHATLHEAGAYVDGLNDLTPTAGFAAS